MTIKKIIINTVGSTVFVGLASYYFLAGVDLLKVGYAFWKN